VRSSRSKMSPAASSVRVKHRYRQWGRYQLGAVLKKPSSRSEMSPAAASVQVKPEHLSRLLLVAVLKK
jgi:hypothetical protein